MKNFLYLIFLSSIFSCSEGTNFNKLIVSKEQASALDSLMYKASLAYDKGEYDEAHKHAIKAYDLSPENEEVSILLGYIELGFAKIGPFDLAKKMIDINETKDSSSTALLASSSNAGDSLAKLTSIVGLTETDFDGKLGEKLDSDSDIFEGLPVLQPYCADEARVNVEVLTHLNNAIKYVCAFAPEEIKTDDPRHDATNCVPSERYSYFQTKTKFLWAFSHLAEAIVFYSVFSYATQDSGKSNLEVRASRIAEEKPESLPEITEFVEAVDELNGSIANLLPIGPDACIDAGMYPQMRAMLNDLKATNYAFATMPGIPPSMSKSIVQAIDKVEKFGKSKVGDDKAQAQNDALKAQFTKKLTTQLGSKIKELSDNGTLDGHEEELDQLCDSFVSIAGTGSDVAKPENCP